MTLSESLYTKMINILSVNVELDEEKGMFFYKGSFKRGIDRALRHLVFVPEDWKDVGWKDQATEKCAQFNYQRVFSSWDERICPSTSELLDYFDSVSNKNSEHFLFSQRVRNETNGDVKHGLLVDHFCRLYARYGRSVFRERSEIDYASANLFSFIDQQNWHVVAAQVPIYNREADLATAVDLFVTDKETHTKLILLEIKTPTRYFREADTFFRTASNIGIGRIGDLPCSYFTRAQLQMAFMAGHIERTFGFKLDGVFLIRLESDLRMYNLLPQFAERYDDLCAELKKYIKAENVIQRHLQSVQKLNNMQFSLRR